MKSPHRLIRLLNHSITQLISLSLLFPSCQEKDNRTEIARLVTEWQGKEIVFPPEITFTRYVADTVDYAIPDADYKVLVYVDSLGCTSCKLQLHQWKAFIEQVDSLAGGAVPFLFFFHSGDYQEINYLLKRDGFDRPVCIDRPDQLNRLNRFPSDITFQTFLLDRDNKVVVLGNPVHNLAVRELYLKQVADTKPVSSEKAHVTTATVEQTEADMGRFPVAESRKAVFQLRNTGSQPLVILGTATTCGCARSRFDKHPASPGETLEVEVEMTPKDKGFFSETITVKCNTDKHIKLRIKGYAI